MFKSQKTVIDAKLSLIGAIEVLRQVTNDLNGMTPLQKGRYFHEFLKQTNPATSKPFTMREAATVLDFPYATFRNLEVLWRPSEYPSSDAPA